LSTENANIILKAKGIGKSFGGIKALSNVNLDIRGGKVNVIVGENGAGKSTLMKVLSGVITSYSGELEWRGEVVKFSNPKEAEKKGITIIHQELNLIPYLTVTQNIFLGKEITNAFGLLDAKVMRRKTKEYLTELGSSIDPDKKISELRVGEQQLVEIARALSTNAEVIIMDEPTSALSDAEVDVLFTIIDDLRKKGTAILYISHKLDELFKIADRFVALRDGQMVGVKEDAKSTTKEGLIEWMVGRKVEEKFTRDNVSTDKELLRVENISVSKTTDQKVSFSLQEGEILGVFGLMGAGRTELFESLYGLNPSCGGKIYVEGNQVKITNPAKAIEAGFALVPEDRKHDGLILEMQINRNIGLPNLDFLVKYGIVQRKTEKELADKYVDELSIKTSSVKQEARNLSGGNQQKVVIGKWLAKDPKILLFDEPTRGIDVGAKSEIYQLISDLAAKGMGILLASSELPEILALSDRVMVMCNSELSATFDKQEATEKNIMNAAIS